MTGGGGALRNSGAGNETPRGWGAGVPSADPAGGAGRRTVAGAPEAALGGEPSRPALARQFRVQQVPISVSHIYPLRLREDGAFQERVRHDLGNALEARLTARVPAHVLGPHTATADVRQPRTWFDAWLVQTRIGAIVSRWRAPRWHTTTLRTSFTETYAYPHTEVQFPGSGAVVLSVGAVSTVTEERD